MALLILQETVPWAGIKWLETTVRVALIIIALLVALIAIFKYLKFRRAIKLNRTYPPILAEAITQGKMDEAFSVSEENALQSHLACVVKAGLSEYRRKGTLSDDLVFDLMRQAMESALIVRNAEHKSNLGFLDAIGATAPFIGALGGSAFTFAFGILLAVPTIWFATYVRNKAERLEADMKNAVNELISYVQIQKAPST